MRFAFALTLGVYLVALMLTQTAYGGGFETLRWLALAVCFLVGLATLLTAARPLNGADSAGLALSVYLTLTAVSIPFAEDVMFSAFRWASHALMLIVLYFLLRRSASVELARWLVWGCKVGLAAAIFLSIVAPAPTTHLDTEALYRGIFGNSNSLGHFAAVAFLLFVHGAAVARSDLRRVCETIAGVVAFALVWYSGARSSFVALSIGVLLLAHYYPVFFRRRFLLGVGCLVLAAIAFPDLPGQLESFVVKRGSEAALAPENVLASRLPGWSASWQGFLERPMFGWGFGAHEGIAGGWTISSQAAGYVTRDPVNDFLFVLESAGFAGLVGYVAIIVAVVSHRPPRARGIGSAGPYREVYDLNVLFAVLAGSLLGLFQFDDTGLSAGNLPSALLWLFAGLAASMRNEFVLMCRQPLPLYPPPAARS